LYFLSLLIYLEEVCLEIVFAGLSHIDLDSSAENNLASVEGLDDLKEVIPRNFEHGIGSACLRISVGCNLSILGLHALNDIGELHIEGARR
jgi:hypothetical protein